MRVRGLPGKWPGVQNAVFTNKYEIIADNLKTYLALLVPTREFSTFPSSTASHTYLYGSQSSIIFVFTRLLLTLPGKPQGTSLVDAGSPALRQQTLNEGPDKHLQPERTQLLSTKGSYLTSPAPKVSI